MQIKALVLLAGGRGTRLSEFTKSIPKPVTPVNGRPIITYLIDWALANGLEKVIICGGYLFQQLQNEIFRHYKICKNTDHILGDISASIKVDEIELQIVDTGLDIATGERIRQIEELVQEEYFLCTYADTLSDIKLADIKNSALKKNANYLVTLGHPDARYGEIIVDAEKIIEFNEKAPPKFLINRGFYIFNRKIFEEILPGESLEEAVLPRLAHEKKLYHHISDSWFHSVDTIMDLESLEERLTSSKKEM
jgi:glucose-1-phosphate cytidylyltransferase